MGIYFNPDNNSFTKATKGMIDAYRCIVGGRLSQRGFGTVYNGLIN